jgi:flagellar basal-body rod protein FlgF
MNDAGSIALSAQLALLRQTDVIANNLANLSTTGFKGQHVLFAEYLGQAADGTSESFVQDLGTIRDPSQGSIAETGNPLDIAIQGGGYLAVDTPLGQRFTRNGHFQLDADGQVVTSQGYPILSDGGSPLTVPQGSGQITIGADGNVTTPQGAIGRLQVVTFDNDQALTPTANGLFSTDQTPQPATNAKVVQGALEASNVQPIIEITHLIAVQRGVEYAKDFTDTQSSMTSSAIDRLGKTL